MSNPIAKVSLYRLDGELRGIVLRTYEGAGLLPLGDHDVYAAPVTAANQPGPVGVPDEYVAKAREAALTVFDGSCNTAKDAIEYFAAELRTQLSAAKPEGQQ